ncbi:MAG: hypothetical protein NW215_08810 [Hyphomicrobiales bacterium]|nr:hypothetical protein [Hyphomicrobiales bacterium]
MLQELLLSVAAGLIVGLVLEVIRARIKRDVGMTQSMPPLKPLPPLGASTKRAGGGAALRVAIALLGGLGVAFIAVSVMREQGFDSGFVEIAAFAGVGAVICWLLLAASMRDAK